MHAHSIACKVGPHAFLADFRSGPKREVVAGISLDDMGAKTTGSDLDNAWLQFGKSISQNSHCRSGVTLRQFHRIFALSNWVDFVTQGWRSVPTLLTITSTCATVD